MQEIKEKIASLTKSEILERAIRIGGATVELLNDEGLQNDIKSILESFSTFDEATLASVREDPDLLLPEQGELADVMAGLYSAGDAFSHRVREAVCESRDHRIYALVLFDGLYRFLMNQILDVDNDPGDDPGALGLVEIAALAVFARLRLDKDFEMELLDDGYSGFVHGIYSGLSSETRASVDGGIRELLTGQ